MKINKLLVKGFRSLQDCTIMFENDLTVIVGENDGGKTSLIDCLKIITQNQPVEVDDFNYNSQTIELQVEIEDFIFKKVYKKDSATIDSLPMEAKPTRNFLERLKTELESNEFNLTNQRNQEKIKSTAKLFGFTVRSNSALTTLRENILRTINDNTDNPNFKIENAQFPNFNNIQLDGKHFENVSSFFKEVFLKERQNSIWQEQIDENKTIETFIKEKIDGYSEEVANKMNDSGMKDKIKLFIKSLTDIRIEPIYQTKDLNIDAKIKFLENGKEINLQKKGDGTKRRITMALLEFKKDEKLEETDNSAIYLLDEPDTHLHVKAQIELLETLQGFSANGNQVILTTHSPFLINSVNPNQIRLLSTDGQNQTRIKHLQDEATMSAKILQSIGIENVYLFFAKTIIFVEGETEDHFIANHFLQRTKKTINSNLIKIINVKGIQNIYGFAKGISELHDPNNIHVVFDNDASAELRELIDRLNIADDRKYNVGNKEFEDSFSDEILFNCWKLFHEDNKRQCPEQWTLDNIRQARQECLDNEALKFSEKLRQLNVGGKKMTKPIFGNTLGHYVSEDHLPPRLRELFTKII